MGSGLEFALCMLQRLIRALRRSYMGAAADLRDGSPVGAAQAANIGGWVLAAGGRVRYRCIRALRRSYMGAALAGVSALLHETSGGWRRRRRWV